MPQATREEPSIAIIGLSCRFPGDASSPSKFWDLLKNARNGFSESTDRYNAEAFYHPKSGKRQNVIPTKGGYFLKQDPYVFDAAFFNITATEAIALDPRQRMAMEVAYEALENAGLPLQKVAGSQTACFMGSSMSDYRDAVARDFAQFPKYHILGISDEMIANRVSHFLDIHGPSATVQTACSSSLVATHIACQSLRSGESEMAIAGGVGLITLTDGTMHLNNLGFLNPAGHSRSFDADANGYGRGEGCGVLILKRLDDAIRDGDNIRAVIRGSGVNSDGWTQGVTMPSLEAQAALIKHVYEAFGLDYGSTQYVEAHGTGTKVGDPIETKAIYSTIGQSSSRKRLYVGSVKPNIGHLEAAAGVASIIKGVLALEQGLIPPNLNFTTPNPAIPLDEWNMVVPTKLTPWPAAKTKRMSISGFGMGGTNAHVVMDAYNGPAALTNGAVAVQGKKKRLFTISSHDKAGFERIGKSLAEYLDSQGAVASSPAYLANLAHTLAKARSGLAWKATCAAESVAELREQLTASTIGENAVRAPSTPPRIGFVFTGQGAQWARMGIEMMGHPVFSESVAKSALFLKEMGCEWDPVTELSRDAKESRLGLPAISQPICSVLQIALVDELRSWGVTPSKVVGHSSGEIAAAYTMGALSHRDALAAAYYRGTASTGLIKKGKTGGMMAVGCSRQEAQKLIQETGLQVAVACVNSPSSVTLSGDVPKLEALRAILDERGVFARRLKVEVAYHSSHMHQCSSEYYSAISTLGQSDDVIPQSITMVSSVVGYEVKHDHVAAPYYWVQNLINPVLFTDAVKELVAPEDEDGERTLDLLVEIGPHSALGGPIEQILSNYGIKNVAYASMLVRGKSALDTSLALASELFSQGVKMDLTKVNGDSNCKFLTDLPPYAWNHSERFHAYSRLQQEQYAQKFPTKSLLGAMQPTMDETERVWRSFIRLNDEPWLRGHTVGTTVLFPAAGMVSMVLEAAQQIVDPGKTAVSFKLRDISILNAMALPESMDTEVVVHMRPHLLGTGGSTPAAWWEFTVSSCSGTSGQLRNNCRGLISIIYGESKSAYMKEEDDRVEAGRIAEYHRVLSELPEACTKEHFYDRFLKASIPYGEHWQGVEKSHPGVGQSVFEVKSVDIEETFSKEQLERAFLIHPTVLDAVWQGYLGSTCDGPGNEFGFSKPMVPTSIAELEISVDIPGDVGYAMPGVSTSHKQGFSELSANITMLDKDLSKVLVATTGLKLSALDIDDAEEDGDKSIDVDPAEITSEVHWRYALGVMEPVEISQLLDATATTDARLIQLVEMAIHYRPTVNVIELVENAKNLPTTVVSKLSEGIILPTQVRYAVVDGELATEGSEKVFGQPFTLGALDAPLPADAAPADLIIIPHHASSNQEGLSGILERLLRMAKPGALVAITTSTGNFFNVVSPTFKAKNFDLVSRTSSEGESLVFYSQPVKRQEKTTNGVHQESVVIIQPTAASSESLSFSQKLQDALREQGHAVSIKTGLVGTETTNDKLFISLLELEKPVLSNLSEPEFLSLRKLMVNSERLLWVTCGNDPLLGMVDGLARCANVEIGSSRFQVLHLTTEGAHQGPSLAARIFGSSEKTTDNEFRERGGLLQVPRMYSSTSENQHVRHHIEDSIRIMSLNDDEGAAFRLTIGKPGLLDSLHFVRDENILETPLGDDELEIQVKATGVNFRDIMASMGLVHLAGLGVEASGVVLRAGSRAAKSFQAGDRVSTLSMGGTHATKTRCDSCVTAKLPDAMSFEEGAAVSTAHVTAYFALVKLAKLSRGQSVLIHAASGGVGQAAMQLAANLGLVTYVTVGTEDKRRFVMEHYGIPEEHIFNSRDSSFAKGIQRVTDGRGVDCVLNSLSGELLRVSWNCLATFGTFVEIGTRDITDNMRLDMRPFSRSTTFTSFDIPTLIEEDPSTLGAALNDVFQLFRMEALHVPHPLTVYPVGQAESAFRTMQQGKHRGKIVLSFSDEDKAKAPVLCKAQDSLKLDPNATFLIVGGLGGLGRSLARQLVASGARHLAFISRSGDSKPEAKAIVNELIEDGAQVKVFRGDVGDKASFLNAMEQCSQQLPPVKGVVQMAMVLRDTLIENMTYEDWTLPLQPKVDGTWNLHEYFNHERPLDFMIFCSSFTGLIGNPGQAQYCAGNTYQDTLAQFRRDQGLKAVSIDLGIMLDVGILADTGSHNFKQWENVLGIHEPAFHAVMKSLINGQQLKRGDDKECPVQVCLSLGTADILTTHRVPDTPWFKDILFAPLTVSSVASSTGAGGEGAAAASLSSRLTEAGNNKDFAAATDIITGALVAKVAEILRVPPSEIDASRPLYAYGVDSLVAMEVRNWITRELKANMPLLEILSAVSIESFAGQIAQKSKLLAK